LEGRLLVASPRERLALKLFGRVGGLARRVGTADMVHAHFAPDGLLALPLARALKAPLVTTLHGYDVTVPPRTMLASGRLSWMRYALLRRRLMDEGALFLAVSDSIRARAIAAGFPEARTLTHYLGTDLTRFSPGAPEPGLIVHVGRLVEKKGTETLLRALALLPEPRLAIVGDGPIRRKLERLAGALGVAERVTFLGALPHDETAQWIGQAWVLAVPSVTAASGDSEGLPTVILEAAGMGVPTVGSRHSGIVEAVEEGRSGFLLPEGDSQAMAARLGEVLASPDLRHRLGSGARAVAAERFDFDRQIARLESLYDSLL
jgi:glycosyltransferase involved in cell wall biosynthesis